MIQILIVDDEKPICDLIQMSLTRAGYHCTCVYDGLAAADILERNVFAFPKMSVTIAGEPADDYGRQDAALSGQLTDASYGGVYGWDNGEVILDTGTTGRGNLLMLGESYDNAILKLMASHFDRVYSVDLRSYEQDMGKPFRLAEYLREHRITKVLLIGSTPFFTSDDFMVED